MISNRNYNILQLYNLFTNEFSAFDFAFRMNLLYQSFNCRNCGSIVSIYTGWSKMLPRSKILPHFPYVKKTRENFEMNAKEGRRLDVLEIDTIFNNLLCIFSNTTSRYIIRRLLRNQYQSRNEQAAALYDIIKTDLDINISIRRIASINLVDNSNLSKYIRNPQRKKLGRKPKLHTHTHRAT